MARIGIVFGLLLCILAGAGLVGSEVKLPILVFPMMIGIPLLFCGVVGLNPHRRRLSMFSAAIIAVFGLLTAGGRVVFTLAAMSRGRDVNVFALKLVAIMVVLCLLFLAAYVACVLRGRSSKAITESS